MAMHATASGFPLVRHNVFFDNDYRSEFEQTDQPGTSRWRTATRLIWSLVGAAAGISAAFAMAGPTMADDCSGPLARASWLQVQPNGCRRAQSHRQIASRPSSTRRPLQLEALQHHGGDQAHFEHGKVLADAHPWPGAES